MLAPILLFVYNRPKHTLQTIEALEKNTLASKSELFIFSDAPKYERNEEYVEIVRRYIKNINGFKKVTIVERDQNLGLANSIISGVTEIIEKYAKVIVLEDDLITSPFFLKFMNEGLDFYYNYENIFSITGFSFSSQFMDFPNEDMNDIYLNIRPMSWSWATWKEQWLGIDWDILDFQKFKSSPQEIKKFNKGGTDLSIMLERQMRGKLDSWYIRWSYHSYIKNKFTIYPKISFVNNIGHDNSGVHCKSDKNMIYSHFELNNSHNFKFNNDIKLKHTIVKSFNKAFNLSWKVKIEVFLKKLFKVEI